MMWRAGPLALLTMLLTSCGGGSGASSVSPGPVSTSPTIKVTLDPSMPTASVAEVTSPYGSSTPSSSGSAVVPLPSSVTNPVVVVATNSKGALLAAGFTSGSTLTLNATTTATVLARLGIGGLPSNVTISQVDSAIQGATDFQALANAVQANLSAGTPPGASSSVMDVLPKVISEAVNALIGPASTSKMARKLQTVSTPLPYDLLTNSLGNVTVSGSAQNQLALTNGLQVYFSATTENITGTTIGTAELNPTDVLSAMFGSGSQTNITSSGDQFKLTLAEDTNAEELNVTQITVNTINTVMQTFGVSLGGPLGCVTTVSTQIMPPTEAVKIVQSGNFNTYFSYLQQPTTFFTIANGIASSCGVGISVDAGASIVASFIPIFGQIYAAYNLVQFAASVASLGSEVYQAGLFLGMTPITDGVCMNGSSVVDCVSSITITPAAPVVVPGGTVQLTAVAHDSTGGNIVYPDTLSWNTSYPGLSVSSVGLVTASSSVSAGSATVTVTDPLTGIAASTAVTVNGGFTVGGLLSGLNSGTQVTLENNGADQLTLKANGPFAFSAAVAEGGKYDVTVSGQPTGETCTVSNGSGTASSDVTSVQVTCSASTSTSYTIGGTLSGLASGASVILEDNGGDALTLSTNGTFTFSTPVLSGNTYAVTVSTQPSGQTCSVSSGNGTATSNVTNVQVTCASSSDQFGAEEVIYNFKGGSDGCYPTGGLLFDSSGDLFGTTTCGGEFGAGTVFELKPNGTGGYAESILYSFTGYSDGSSPGGGLIMDSSGNLYGTTEGSFGGQGTVFELSPYPGGAGPDILSTLYAFTGGSDGGMPVGGLVMDSAGNLYGTTSSGGNNGAGTVFKLVPNGSGGFTESTIYSLPSGPAGAVSGGGVIIDHAGDVYGTSLAGTVFKLTPNGAGGYAESALYAFVDGGVPETGVIMDGKGNLFGTAAGDGAYGGGTAFELTPNGTGGYAESVLYSFIPTGADPLGLTINSAGDLYGTDSAGGIGSCSGSTGCGCDGSDGCGIVFSLTPNGIGGYSESVIYTFTGGADGAVPDAHLIMDSASNLYGTTTYGGSGKCTFLNISGCGTVFEIPAK